MPGTVTIDFQDRTRASITCETVPPRWGDVWTEMLYHLAFCVGRTLVNLEREDQIENARQFDAWLGNGFVDFPVHVGPPAVLVPCARFVSSFDGDAPSYVRGAYGFGLNARGLDYYGPMAAGVLLYHVHGVWDRVDELLLPVRILCRRVAAGGVDEAGHVMLVTECVTEAIKDFERRGVRTAPIRRPPADRAPVPTRTGAGWKSWRNAFAGAGVALILILGVTWYLQTPSPAPLPEPSRPLPSKTPARPSVPEPAAESPKSAGAVSPLSLPEAPSATAGIPPAPAPTPRLESPVKPKAAPVKPEPSGAISVGGGPAQGTPPVSTSAGGEATQMKPEQRPVQEARVVQPSPAPALERVMTGRDGAPMVLVPSGEFLMGSEAEEDATPHRVYLDAFYIDRYEVTNSRYQKFVEATRHRAPQHVVDPQYDLWAGTALPPGVGDLPVINVDWSDADTYCKWAGKRLPTEAEWEKAARGTDGRPYPWGNEAPSFVRLNFSRRWQGAHTLQPVGSYESGSSPYGAQDMAGNVWEWVSDWYGAGSYSGGQARNPQGPSGGSSKILRGGSWTNSADAVRVTHRREEDPEMRNSDSGFRCAYSAPAR